MAGADEVRITELVASTNPLDLRPIAVTAPVYEPMEFNSGEPMQFNNGEPMEFNL